MRVDEVDQELLEDLGFSLKRHLNSKGGFFSLIESKDLLLKAIKTIQYKSGDDVLQNFNAMKFELLVPIELKRKEVLDLSKKASVLGSKLIIFKESIYKGEREEVSIMDGNGVLSNKRIRKCGKDVERRFVCSF